MRSSYKTIGIWVILIILFIAFYRFSQNVDEEKDISFADFQEHVEQGHIAKLTIKGSPQTNNQYTGTLANTNEKFRATGPSPDTEMLNQFRAKKVNYNIVGKVLAQASTPAPVLPAETMASASPSRTSRAATNTDASGFASSVGAGLSCMATKAGAWCTDTRSALCRMVASAASMSALSPTNTA